VTYKVAWCHRLILTPFAGMRGSVVRAGSLARCAGALACLFLLAVVAREPASAHPAGSSPACPFCFAWSILRRFQSFLSCGVLWPARLFSGRGSARCLSILGRFRSVRLVGACGRPAVAFAGFAGSAGFALLFSRVLAMVSRRSQVRTSLIMRVSSVYRPPMILD
jgi:hypothetical protein